MINIAQPLIGDEEIAAVTAVMRSGILAQGPQVKAFEEAFAQLCGVQHAIATSSGTTALHLMLLAHGIGPGDEVITSPFTFIASANSVLYTGAKPVFVDIDPHTFNIDPHNIEAAITPHTKAIMPVHLFGLSCDMHKIQAIANKHNLLILEDAAQSHGATYHGQPIGSFGTAAFSLYPTKNMTSAEGGMITTNDATIADSCRILRQHGMRRRYYHDELGYNFRMTDIHAAIGLVQLKKLPHFNKRRQTNAAMFNNHLRGVTTPTTPEGYEHVYHQYTLRVNADKRDTFIQHMLDHDIRCGIYYPVPIHQQKVYQERGYKGHYPRAEQIAQEVVSIPIHPGLSPANLEHIITTINEFDSVTS